MVTRLSNVGMNMIIDNTICKFITFMIVGNDVLMAGS